MTFPVPHIISSVDHKVSSIDIIPLHSRLKQLRVMDSAAFLHERQLLILR